MAAATPIQAPPVCSTPTRAETPTPCAHCGSPLGLGATGPFCCTGCAFVHDFLETQGLERFYALRPAGAALAPAPGRAPRDRKWLESFEASLASATGPVRIALDVQGLQCASCVWLLEQMFARRAGGLAATVNPARGAAELVVQPGFALRAYVEDCEAFGYLFGPPGRRGDAPARANALLTRIGVCVALAMNAMIFALPLYLGLRTGIVHAVFRALVFALGTASMLVGGSVFVRSAWLGLRRGVLHLDLPIALGIVLAFAGSTYGFVRGDDGASYFDTLAIFVALMLVGRWLQERVLERNRAALPDADSAESLLARRVRGDVVELVRCGELRAGDALLVAPGDLVTIDGALESPTASCSLDWIHGESEPRAFARGATVPAGAFNAGPSAISVRASTDFDASPLVTLLRTTRHRDADRSRATPAWQRIARVYTVAVLTAAGLAFVAWLLATHDARRALAVTTAVLVVTCPCAFGLATPMAYELVQTGLRRAGLYVRSASFLDRALAVRTVVFDKTGTLTTGVLRVTQPERLDALSAGERRALFNLAARSSHPRSLAVREAIARRPVAFDPTLTCVEYPGLGLELVADGVAWRLGEPAWAAGAPTSEALVFARDGRVVCSLDLAEMLRADAPREVARLRRDGYDVFVLSGDAPARVARMGEALGLAPDHVFGGEDPAGKVAWLAAHDAQDTLMVGDGLNDALAVDRAFCSGTPAIDRPFMPARSDFYFVSPGLAPIGLALRAARALARVNRRSLVAAVGYNTIAVGLACAGLMSPLLCAVFMPASSLTVLLATIVSLSPRSALWRS